MRKKTSFTLLEVIIAIALTALCAPILFSVPFRFAKREIHALFHTELERLVDKEWGYMMIDLKSQGPAWQEMTKNDDVPRLLEQKKISIRFSSKQNRTYLLKKEIVSIKSKQKAKLFQVKISLKSDTEKKEHSFNYLFSVPI